ncbi:hypothetical protein SUGI_0756470 [Cryptomeria japonica]|nr:hypothetical protein SUGI_0756470 [Cryptomeria japonica]
MVEGERSVGGNERHTHNREDSGKERERSLSPGKRFERKMDALMDMVSLMMGKMGQNTTPQNNSGHRGEYSASKPHDEHAGRIVPNNTNISSRPFKPTFLAPVVNHPDPEENASFVEQLRLGRAEYHIGRIWAVILESFLAYARVKFRSYDITIIANLKFPTLHNIGKKHTYVCPQYASTRNCSKRSICKFHHPKSKLKTKLLVRMLERTSKDREHYFVPFKEMGYIQSSSSLMNLSGKESTGVKGASVEDETADYISLSTSEEDSSEDDVTEDNILQRDKAFFFKLGLETNDPDLMLKPILLLRRQV